MGIRISRFNFILSAALAGISVAAHASHHFEVAEVAKTPAYNQTDNFVFEAAEPGKTVFVMLVNHSPKTGPGEAFAKDALYNIHISDTDKFDKGHTFSFRFGDRNVTVTDLANPNGKVGEVGSVVGTGAIGSPLVTKGGVKVWTGVAHDPFFGNSPGLHQWQADLAAGVYDKDVWVKNNKTSIFKDRKVAAIVIEVPNQMLGADVKEFATTAVQRAPGKWEQIQYSARPLFSHAMLLESQALRGVHDHSRPTTATEIGTIVSARASRCSALAKSQADPLAYGDKIAKRLLPDVLDYKPGTKASYTVESTNGRSFDDDGMSVMLSFACGMAVDQAIPNPKLHQAAFPYVLPVAAK